MASRNLNSCSPVVPSKSDRDPWRPELAREAALVGLGKTAMKNFPDGVFTPDEIEIMTAALEKCIESLPDPVSTSHVDLLAESILRSVQAGERDVATLKRLALVELNIRPR
jgi:hypothetical protein